MRTYGNAMAGGPLSVAHVPLPVGPVTHKAVTPAAQLFRDEPPLGLRTLPANHVIPDSAKHGPWKLKAMWAMDTLTHPFMVCNPACPDTRHPTRVCGCRVFRTIPEALEYQAIRRQEVAPMERPGAVVITCDGCGRSRQRLLNPSSKKTVDTLFTELRRSARAAGWRLGGIRTNHRNLCPGCKS